MNKKKSYFRKLLLYFFLFSMVPLVSAGAVFYAIARGVAAKSAAERGTEAAGNTAAAVAEHLEYFRHVAYLVSKLPEISQIFTMESPQKDSLWLKKLYSSIYSKIEGHLSEARIHILSADGREYYSTHQLPRRYKLDDYPNTEGIFAERRDDPERSYLYLDPFVAEDGERIVCSFLREIKGGYVIVDLTAQALVSMAEQNIFSSMVLAQKGQFLAFDFFRPERSGRFDHFPELALVAPPGKGFSDNPEPVFSGSELIIQQRIPRTTLYLVGSIPFGQYRNMLGALLKAGIWILMTMSLAVTGAAFFISMDISIPIHSIVSAMDELPRGRLPKVRETGQDDELGELVKSYNKMAEKLDELVEHIREEERLLGAAERRALQAQINPHFLYNSLGAIKSMAKLNNVPEIAEISSALAKMFRAAAAEGDGFTTMKESLSILESYASIQYHRFGERLKVKFSLPRELEDFPVPKLIIQPLVENAIVHGLDSPRKNLFVALRAEKSPGGMKVIVEDNGPGINLPGDLSPADNFGTGLNNVKRRMELIYQGKGNFSLENRKGPGTKAILLFPKIPKEASS